jgi:excisionase family DNA binding protein
MAELTILSQRTPRDFLLWQTELKILSSKASYTGKSEEKMYTNLDDIPAVMTPEEAAKILNIGMNSIYSLLRSGNLSSVKIGKQYRITKNNLIKFLDT